MGPGHGGRVAHALERGGGPAPAGGGGGARSRYRRRSRSGGPRAAAATAAAGGRDRTRYGGARGPIRTGERRGDRGGGGSALDRAPLRRLAGGPPPGRRTGLGAPLRSGAALTAKIAVLSQQVADQIAAGEVVERPASVVKELVENALDAGARAIRVEIENGGKTLIRVSDDGEGMSRGDAELALARHATSKIRDAADLIGVGTFGFRGEALPAIASVSRFELETSPDGRSGTRIRVVGGKCEAVEDAVRQHGTTVTVRALFFNTPARRKFLRAQATETRAAAEVVTLLALARPDVAFRLASDDRVLIDVPPAEQAIDRLHGLWGRELASTLVAVAHREGPLEVRGFAQRPAQAKPAGRRGCVFVRGRPIRDPFILRAAEAGYRSTIAPGDRPSLILFLDLPGDAVDVNVHPAKLEVRFRDKFFVEKVVEEAVRRALGPLAAAAPLGTGGEVLGASGVWTELGLAIVDQHSAHERVLYESVMRHLQGDGAPAQRLLLPLTLEFAPPELEAIAAHGEALRRVGYEIEPLSGRAVVVHTAPNPHPRFDAARCLQELVADLAGGRFGALANRLERFAATFACHAAVKAGQRLEPEETRELVMRLLTATLPAHDVHGRPTIVQLPRGELERRFGRA